MRQCRRPGASLLLVLALAAGAVGCVVQRIERKAAGQGVHPPDGVLEAIREGETTREQVIETLGLPLTRQVGEDGREVLTYSFVEIEERRTDVLFLIHTGGQRTHILELTFEIEDGVVARFRQNRSP
ncbi:MAG: hypothetical protein ACYS8L_05395 [Planctomycetota bacterium]|jgi:outer membrane protein assembly factor BamE (lipoprotein component of BamABCDE complex)